MIKVPTTKTLLRIASIGLFCGLSVSAQARVDVNINIGDPGYYGRLPAIAGWAPSLINTAPVVAVGAPPPGAAPIYLRVPKAHRMNWRQYCGRYNACGLPVFFVSHDWYRDNYAPAYRQKHGNPPPAQPPRQPAPKAAPAPRPQPQGGPKNPQPPRNNGPQGPQGPGPR